jgi:hypothetical protein
VLFVPSDEFGTDHAGWNTVIHDIRVDFNSRIATVFAPEKGNKKGRRHPRIGLFVR